MKLMFAVMMLVGAASAQQTGGGGGVPGGNTGGGTTTNPATFNNSGTGAASGATFNGSAAQTISYNTIGAAPASGGTISPKVINGVSYSNLYTGSTLDVRVNACIADAMALANGNTSGVCSSEGEGGLQNIANTITVGNSSGATVTWRLPNTCQWGVNMGTTAASAIVQWNNTAITGPAHNWQNCQITQNTSVSVGSLYKTQGGGYYKAEGFMLFNNGNPDTNGAVMEVLGSVDTSVFNNIAVFNGTSTAVDLKVAGGTTDVCCATNFTNLQLNSNSAGGIVLDVEGSSSAKPFAVNFFGSTFTHPKAGSPAILLHDTNTARTSQVNFYGGYIETNTTDLTTSLIQIDGFGQVGIYGFQVLDPYQSSSTAAGISVSSAFATSLTVSDYTQFGGFTFPSTAIINSATGQTIHTDSASPGHLVMYNSGTTYADGALTVDGTLVATSVVLGSGGNGINGVNIGLTNDASGKFAQLLFRSTTITASATPAMFAGFTMQTITLSASAVPTISGITTGARYGIQVCQPSSGGPFTWTWPSTFHGGGTIGTGANTCSVQWFDSFNGTSMEAESAMITGLAP